MTTTERLYTIARESLKALVSELERVNREDAMRALAALKELECLAPLKVRVTTTALPCGALYEGKPSGKTYACARPQGHAGKHKSVSGAFTWGGIGSGLAQEEMPDATEGWPV